MANKIITSQETPIYKVLSNIPNVTAAYTGKGTSRSNHNFSFSTNLPPTILSQNLTTYSQATNIHLSKITWPNGWWPHSGYAIIAEKCQWHTSEVTGGCIPSFPEGIPIQYDGIVTRSPDFVLGVQGADCPSIFLVDEAVKVIGLAHSGWKPTVQGVVRNTVGLMQELGAKPEKIRVFISPGVGDRYNEFSWGESMEWSVKRVFEEAKREDLLRDLDLRYVMNEEDKRTVKDATGREVKGGVSFRLASLIVRDLVEVGVKRENIEVSGESTICERRSDLEAQGSENTYKYHSARRDNGKDPERPGFGSNLCILQLVQTSQSQL